jgi:hypothetical protein
LIEVDELDGAKKSSEELIMLGLRELELNMEKCLEGGVGDRQAVDSKPSATCTEKGSNETSSDLFEVAKPSVIENN